MSKSVKKSLKEKPAVSGNTKTPLIPPKYQTLAAAIVILLVFAVYYAPMYFGDQTFSSGDIITSKSTTSYIDNEHEEFTLWYPYIFCGMPGYTLNVGYKWFNLMWVGLDAVRTVFVSLISVNYAVWTLYLLILAFSSYFLVLYLTENKLISLFASLSMSFSTGIVLFLMIGHVTKLTALCFFPLMLLILLKFEKKITLKDIALLVITLQLSLQGWHVQIIFYMLFAIMIYYIYNLVYSWIKKEMDSVKQFFKSGLIFSGAFIVALLIQSDNLTQIYEYNPYSTRGTKNILEKDKADTPQAESDFYQYATNWSFPPEDVGTFIVPSYMGFGKSTYQGPLTKNTPVVVNTYFGEIPLTENPMYMGVIVLFLAIFGVYTNYKKRFVQFLALLSVFSLVVSFGRYFSPVYDLMFYYFPFFDKFRAPIMTLVLLQMSLPVLAAYGIKSIIDLLKSKDDKLTRIILYTAIVLSALLLISFLANSGLKNWFVSRVNEFAASNPRMAQQFRALADYMSDMFVTDLQISLMFLMAVFWLAYAVIKNKIQQTVFLVVVVAVSFIDIARVNKRFEEYHPEQNSESLFTEPDYITEIKKQNDDQPFRILNLKQDGSLGSFTSNSNFNAYFLIDDLYGYSAVKPRTYQDYMDVVGPLNPTLWRMLNVKYLIFDKPNNLPFFNLIYHNDNTFLYEYTSALPRAYFVDSVATLPALEILNNVKDNTFDPKNIAYVEETNASIDTPDSTVSVTFTKFLDERIELDVTASGNNLLFLGDTYYPKGWRAHIDGEETQIHQVNHGFRGIVVPAGKHKIDFIYHPTSFVLSKYTAISLSSLVIVALILGFFIERKKKQIE